MKKWLVLALLAVSANVPAICELSNRYVAKSANHVYKIDVKDGYVSVTSDKYDRVLNSYFKLDNCDLTFTLWKNNKETEDMTLFNVSGDRGFGFSVTDTEKAILEFVK